MTGNRIKEAALTQFALHGYEGASLAAIANEVGIRKQSIYTHFKGKDELFLEVFRSSIDRELQFVRQYFESSRHESFKNILYGFLLKYLERYELDDNTCFFLRTVFFPPFHLRREIMEGGNDYIFKLEHMMLQLIRDGMRENRLSMAVDEDTAVTAYVAILDGLFVEMLFSNAERARTRLHASWSVYWRGIQQDER